jgi:hypothetical protein
MKHYLLPALLISFILPTTAVFAAEGEEMPDLERARQHMEMQRMEMELESDRAELEFENEMRQLELEAKKGQLMGKAKRHHDDKGKCRGMMAIILIVHILTAIWVYQDIKKRSDLSGVWIVIALLTGLLGTLVYAVVRLGETPKKDK